MTGIQQNTLYLLTPGSYISRDHLTLQVEVPIYPGDLPSGQRNRDTAIDTHKLSIPIHHLESICAFGASTISPPALALCWEHGVAVNFLSEHGQFQARMTGVTDTSVTLRRTQFRAADDRRRCAGIARQIVAGKIQNSRNSLLRAARETDEAGEQEQLQKVIAALAGQIEDLANPQPSDSDSGLEERGARIETSFDSFRVRFYQVASQKNAGRGLKRNQGGTRQWQA